MKRLILLILLACSGSIRADLIPPLPATAAEVAAGTARNKYVSPATLATLGIGTTTNYAFMEIGSSSYVSMSMAANTYRIISNYNTIQLSGFSGSTNGSFTNLTAGDYLISGSVQLAGGATTTNCYFALFTNGVRANVEVFTKAGPTLVGIGSFSIVKTLAANTRLELYVKNDGGTATIANNGTTFSAVQVGGSSSGGVGALTPWTSDINGGGYSLTNVTNVVLVAGGSTVTLSATTNTASLGSATQLSAGSFAGAGNVAGDFFGNGRSLTNLNADSLFYTNKIIDLGTPRYHDMTLGTFGAGLPDPIGWTTASGYHGATWSINPSDVVGTNLTFRTTFGSEIGTNTFTFRYYFSWWTTNGVYVPYPTAGSADVTFTMTNKGFYTLTNSFSVNLGTTNFAAYQVNIAFFNETNIVGFKQVTLQIK